MQVRPLIVIALLLLSSCSRHDAKDEEKHVTRFSIIQFAEDQWQRYKGQPYGLLKKVTFNGATDSTYTNVIDFDWTPVMKVFFETDISAERFEGQYSLTAFNDSITKTNTFLYEAKNKKLYTKKLQIIANERTNRIEGIYIEAGKNDRMGTRELKLLYVPVTSISIQELETSRTGRRKEMRVVYDFM